MDEGEVSRAYQSYAFAVHARCRRLLRDDAAARDVTQEVFVRCFDKRDGLRCGRELLSWLYRVATNLCLNAIRDSKARRTAHQEASETQRQRGGAATNEAPSPRLVMDLLQGLDDRTQAIVVYVYVDGMTHAEAAEVAQVSDRTVRNCLSRFLEQGRLRLGIDLQENCG